MRLLRPHQLDTHNKRGVFLDTQTWLNEDSTTSVIVKYF